MPAASGNGRNGVDRMSLGGVGGRLLPGRSESAPRTELARLAAERGRRMALQQGNHLYWRDGHFKYVCLIQAGSVKTYNVDLAGEERIRAFHFPGEFLGLDGIADGSHHAHAEALEATVVYGLPFERLLQFAAQSAPLQLALFRCLAREYDAAVSHGGDFTAEQRMAAFVLELSERSPGAGGADCVNATMTRREMGKYLRLATATVSRTLAAMQSGGLLRANGKRIDIVDRSRLRDLAEPVLSS